MKKFILTTALIILCTISYSQTVAEDWTEIDCNSTEHNLFTELDLGYCVIMEFVMPTGCVPCITAAENIGPLVEDYNLIYDNRVKYYTFGYNESYTCDIMLGWAEDYSLNATAEFRSGTDILAYYGSMGMPTIVIVGGEKHEVHYEKMGFAVSDMDNIEEAILAGLGTEDTSTTAIVQQDNFVINIYPNPASEIAVIDFKSGTFSPENISLTDLKGSEIEIDPILFSPFGPGNMLSFNVGEIPDGIYFIQFLDKGCFFSEKLIVNH